MQVDHLQNCFTIIDSVQNMQTYSQALQDVIWGSNLHVQHSNVRKIVIFIYRICTITGPRLIVTELSSFIVE
jgi:hypothetical protein